MLARKRGFSISATISPADAAEDENLRAARKAAIEPDRGRAEPCLKRAEIKEAPGNAVAVRRRQGEQDAALAAIDMDGQQPVLRARAREHLGGRIDGESGNRRGGGEQQESEAKLHGADDKLANRKRNG